MLDYQGHSSQEAVGILDPLTPLHSGPKLDQYR
jgi:hypothetical protein